MKIAACNLKMYSCNPRLCICYIGYMCPQSSSDVINRLKCSTQMLFSYFFDKSNWFPSATLSSIIVPWNCFGMYLQSLGTAVRFSHQSFEGSAWPEKVATRVHAHSMLPFPSFELNLATDQLFSLNGSFWRFRRLANRFSSKGSFCHKYGKPGCAFRFRN